MRIDPRGPVRELGVAQQQMVEIAKALRRRGPAADHGRADLGAHRRSEIDAAVRDDPAADRPGRRHHLHLAPARGGARASATASRCCATASTWRTHAVGEVSLAELIRLMANRELTEHYPKRRVPRGEELLRVEGAAGRRARTTSASRSTAARCSASPACSAPAAPSWRAPSRAPTRRRPAASRSRARPCAPRAPRGRDPPGHRLPARGPQDPGAGPRLLGAATTSRSRARRGCRASAGSTAAPRQRSPRDCGRATCGSGRRAWSRRSCCSERRQPAEGRARQVAGRRRRRARSSTSRRAASTWRPRWRSTS